MQIVRQMSRSCVMEGSISEIMELVTVIIHAISKVMYKGQGKPIVVV